MRPSLTMSVLAVLCLFVAPEAEAARAGGVRFEVLVGGRPLSEIAARGTQYVEAQMGREYSLRVHNESGRRVAVAVAVDGLNVVDASHTAASDAPKWVLGPGEEVVIDGWQVDAGRARRFLFTSETKSYGAWLGDTRNLGTVSAVVFAEHTPPCCAPVAREDRSGYGARSGGRAESMEYEAPAASSAPAGPARQKAADEYAATGAGRSTRQDVEWVEFDFDRTALASIDLRYGFRDELVSLGVLPQPPVRDDRALSRRESSEGFAPEPSPWCCR